MQINSERKGLLPTIIYIHKWPRKKRSRLMTAAYVAGSVIVSQCSISFSLLHRCVLPLFCLPRTVTLLRPDCRPIIVIHKSPSSLTVTHNTIVTRVSSEKNRWPPCASCQMRPVTHATRVLFRASRRTFRAPGYGQSTRVMRTPRDPVTDWGSRRRRSAAVTRGDTAN